MYTSKTLLCDMQAIRDALLSKLTDPTALPIRYALDGKEYHGIPAEFAPKTVRKIIDANITERTYSCLIPGTPLKLWVECQEYKDFPVWEWTAYFENIGNENSPVISDFFAMDTVLPGAENAILCHNNGDYCSRDGLETTETTLRVGETFTAACTEGHCCDRAWPYYRILSGEIAYNIAIGWPGGWKADFEMEQTGIRVQAKQAITNFYLKPGEIVRSPRMVVMALKGDSDRAINMWRRYYFDHCMCRTMGNPLDPKVCYVYNGGGDEHTEASEQNQIEAIQIYMNRGEKPDVWWIDAGWYPCKNPAKQWSWVLTGDWRPDPERFPNGFGKMGQLCEDNGIQPLLWFMPEFVRIDMWPEENDPSFICKLKESAPDPWYNKVALLYLGNPEARQWLTDRVNSILREGKFKIYRQDFWPAPFPNLWWNQIDGEENRAGMAENLHTQGYLRFWDDLLMENPDLWLDSCAGGGRRNDIEALRRAVPLHATDYGYGEHPVKQAFQKTWFEWTPYFRSLPRSDDDADGNYYTDKPAAHGFDFYCGHCAFAPSTEFPGRPYDSAEDFALASSWRKLFDRAAAYTLNSDFFCLTPVRKSTEDYFSIQFYKEDDKEGLIQIIRNAHCPDESITVYPKALDAEAIYEFEAPEIGRTFTASGAQILEKGLTVSIPARSGIFWFYKAVNA